MVSCNERASVGFFGFILLLLAAVLLLTALFTQSWLEERFEGSAPPSPTTTVELEHGLYYICSRKYSVAGQRLAVGNNLTRIIQSQATMFDKPDYVCVSRFEDKCLEVNHCEPIDNVVRDHHRNNSYWEIVCLTLMCVTCTLTLLILIAYFCLYGRLPSVLAILTLLAAFVTLAVLIIFACNYGVAGDMKDHGPRIFVDQKQNYGYSYWLTICGCALQFLAFILMSFRVCNSIFWKYGSDNEEYTYH